MRDALPSRTADRVALRRAAHQLLDRPPVFHDPLALRILPLEVAARLKEAPHEFERSPVSRYLRAFLAVRSRVAEDALAEAVGRGVSQYVLVGAGFDTFAYRNPYSSLRVFEVDHPSTQREKRLRLESAGIEVPENASFVAADLSAIPLREALAVDGFRADEPAVFAWLGVLPYLDRAVVEETLAHVASLPRGTTIVFDYGVPRHSLGLLARLVFDRMAARVAKAGEPWKTFFTPAEMTALLDRLGYSSVLDLDGPAINARWFANRADGLAVGEAGHIVIATV